MAFAIFIAIMIAVLFFIGPLFIDIILDTVDMWKAVFKYCRDRRSKHDHS